MLGRLRTFVDERLGGLAAWGKALEMPIPGGASWGRTLGPALIALFFLEFATGLALGTVYAPSTQTAWASVFYIQHHFHWGPIVRGVHYWAAQTILGLCGVHLMLVLVSGAYRRPRELNWWAGLLLLGIAGAFAHTGSLLPWDQAAYWTTKVEASITGSTPIVGVPAQRFMQGGSDLGTLSLTRLYVLHAMFLPMLALVLVWLHVRLYRQLRPTPPADVAETAEGGEADAKSVALWPSQMVRDAILALVIVVGVYVIARRHSAPLEAPADPDSNYPARPEWYLLPLFKLRKAFEGPREPIATMVIPGIITAFFVLLPFLDRAKTRSLRSRAPVVGLALIVMFAIATYTAMAYRADARDAKFQEARRDVDRRASRAMQLASAGIPPEGPLEMVRNDPLTRPGELYEQHCATCHKPANVAAFDRPGHRSNARGPALEGFGSRAWAIAVMNDPQGEPLFHRTVIDDMPSQARRPGVDVNAVAEYLYSQSVEPGDPPANADLAHRGDEIFHNKCTPCHQGAGDLTETDPGDRDAPDLTGWGSRAWIRDQILHPDAPTRYGQRNHMPAFGDRLTPRELEFVVDYVRQLRARPAPVVAVPAPHEDEGS